MSKTRHLKQDSARIALTNDESFQAVGWPATNDGCFSVLLATHEDNLHFSRKEESVMLSVNNMIFIVLVTVLASFIEPVAAQDSSAKPAKTSTIIAEGVGASADEALKDAFRNAVRQTVGALVDAETLIKNDEVIDDKVLTYSDGFIKTYEEVAGSKKIQGGLHRIKVKAQVERRSVIAKLKESKVSLKEVDGQGLFAEVVTGEEARQTSTEIVKNALAELPKLWVAEPIGKPDFDKDTSEVVVKVGIRVDSVKYKVFFDKVSSILDKVALRKSTFMSKGELRVERGRTQPIERFLIESVSLEEKPLSEEESKTHWKLLLCHPPRSDLASLRWTLYVVDAAVSDVLSPIELPADEELRVNKNNRINDSPARLVVELCSSAGDIVTDDESVINYGVYTKDTYNRVIGMGDFCPGLITCLEFYREAEEGYSDTLRFNTQSSTNVQLAMIDMPRFLKDFTPTGSAPSP